MSKKEIISYEKYGMLLNTLCNLVESDPINFNVIIAPPRGALPIAVHFSHNLGIDNILITDEQILKFFMETDHTKEPVNILIVDDIADTGKTINNIIHKLSYKININITVATLFYKKRSIIKPKYYCIETNNWIVFPYENINEKPNREGYE